MLDEKLTTLSLEIDAANNAVQLAKLALDEDRQIRSKSLWAGFVGAVSLTPAKRAVREADASLSAVRSRVNDEVSAWVRASAIQAINDNVALAGEREQHKGRVVALTDRRTKIQTWFQAVDNAYDALRSAESKCRSAATMDTLDAFSSKSKMMDVLAYSETSSARTAANRAGQLLSHLAEILPKNAESVEFDAPDGLLGFVVGLSDMPVLDFFIELNNASKLSKVAEKCHQAADQLSPLHMRLQAMLSNADESLAAAAAKLSQFDRALLEKAYAAVPDSIKGAMPSSID